ncbi:MAG: SAM-dependent methyltransferase [Acidimicrobiia bacterium]
MGLSGTTLPGTEKFYDRWTELYLRGFGPVLQAGILRTGDPPREDPEQSVLALAERAGLRDGDRIVDAGCGVAGPAIVIALGYPKTVTDGVTISKQQYAIAQREISAAGLTDRVRVHLADYQNLPFGAAEFDQALFMESTCYATDLPAAYAEAFRVLRPGGRLYVKDVFCRAGQLKDHEAVQMKAFDQLWGCVRSKTMEESVEAMVQAGFDVTQSAPMSDIGTSRLLGSMFQLDGIGLRTSELGEAFLRKDLIPPIEFGEIRAVK